MDDSNDDRLGGRFWLGIIGLAVGAVIAVSIFFIVFGAVWYTWGFLGALLCLIVALLGFGYLFDRRERRRRDRLAT